MKIVFDARWIGPTPSGIGVYAKELLRRLPLLEPSWRWHLLFQSEELRDAVLKDCGIAGRDNVTAEIIPYGIFSPLGVLFKLPAKLASLSCDLFFSANFMIPYRAFPADARKTTGPVCVSTIHDAIPILVKNYAPKSRKSHMLFLFRHCLRLAIRYSHAVITVSETSRKDIVKALSLPGAEAGRIRTIHNGANAAYCPSLMDDRVTSPTKVILYVGRLDPYKNVVTLVRAFAELRHEIETPIHLLLIGPEDPRYPEAKDIARDLGILDHVTFIHSATQKELLSAYRDATVLVSPSSYEGFGLPIIEAMKCGTPVICTTGGAQPEIAGDAATIIPPADATALTEAMRRLLADGKLREKMAEDGLRRARAFDWDETAARTMDLFKEALAKAGKLP